MKNNLMMKLSLLVTATLVLSACGPEDLARAAEAGLLDNLGPEAQAQIEAALDLSIEANEASQDEGLSSDADLSSADDFDDETDQDAVDDSSSDGDLDNDTDEDIHFEGTVEALSATSITIDGQTFAIGENTILDEGLAVGVLARLEFVSGADGALLALQIETDADDDGDVDSDDDDDLDDDDAADDLDDEDADDLDDDDQDDDDNSGSDHDDDDDDNDDNSGSDHDDDD